jgi:hypothetical protein
MVISSGLRRPDGRPWIDLDEWRLWMYGAWSNRDKVTRACVAHRGFHAEMTLKGPSPARHGDALRALRAQITQVGRALTDVKTACGVGHAVLEFRQAPGAWCNTSEHVLLSSANALLSKTCIPSLRQIDILRKLPVHMFFACLQRTNARCIL